MDKLMPQMQAGMIGESTSQPNLGHHLKKAKLITLVTAMLMLKLIQIQESSLSKNREKSRSR